MKSIISKIGIFSLSLLVLFSSFGFTVSTHLCGGEKVKAAIGFVKTDLTCGMKKKPSSCPDKNHIQSTCCQNIFDYYHIEDNVKKERAEIFTPDFVQAFSYVEWIPLYSTSRTLIYFNNFSPPLIVKNILLDHQTFLI